MRFDRKVVAGSKRAVECDIAQMLIANSEAHFGRFEEGRNNGRISAPLKKPDLFVIAHQIVSKLQFAQVLQIAKRHKVTIHAENGSPERELLKSVSRLDESELSRFLMELSLFDSAYRVPSKDADDPLLATAKRYRIETDTIEKEVAQKLSANQKKQGRKPKANRAVA